MMNSKSMALAIALMAGTAASAQTKVSVSGEIVGMADSCAVSLADAEGFKPQTIASAKFVGGKFSLSGEIKGTTRMVKLNVSSINEKRKRWMRLASIRTMVDATPITVKILKDAISGDVRDIELESKVNNGKGGVTIEGGKPVGEMAEYLAYIRPTEWASATLGYAEADAWFKNDGNDEAIAYMQVANAKVKAACEAKSDEFVMAHPDYAVSAALVAQKAYKPFSYSVADFDKLYAAIANNADTAHVNFIKKNINYFRTHGTGADYTDFTAKDKKDKDVKLSSLLQTGKMTLIDFWASWCGPCRSAIPKVKAMAEKYADKLQVVSCSVDEKKAAWLKAEKEENMPWPQLMLPLSALSDKNGAGAAYDISSIPRLVVIGVDGKVLVVTHDPAVVRKVVEANL